MALPGDLQHTPLTVFNIAHGDKMALFPGYEMPVQFLDGVQEEHLAMTEGIAVADVPYPFTSAAEMLQTLACRLRR